MLLWILRGVFAIIILGLATNALVALSEGENRSTVGIAVFAGVLLLWGVAVAIDLFVRNKQITTVSAVYFGTLMGLLLGYLFSEALSPFVAELLNKNLAQVLRLLI